MSKPIERYDRVFSGHGTSDLTRLCLRLDFPYTPVYSCAEIEYSQDHAERLIAEHAKWKEVTS